jgi:DDE_Tnp_1-associated/Transposase DDE domain
MSLSLMEILHTIPDPRKPRGLRHPLAPMLALAVLAILAGHSSLEAIAQFGRDHGHPLAFALGFRRGKTPTKSAFSKLFRRLDIDAFEAALSRWLRTRQQASDWPAIAIDGKTLRGSKDGETPGVHLLTAFVPAAATVIAQMRVDAKTNEHKAALRLLGFLPIQQKVVTGDAMFTHRDFAQGVRDQGGDYLLFAKDNQATLQGQIRSALSDDAGFSPLPTPREVGPGADGANDRQGAWPPGVSPPDEHDEFERLLGLARCGAGV